MSQPEGSAVCKTVCCRAGNPVLSEVWRGDKDSIIETGSSGVRNGYSSSGFQMARTFDGSSSKEGAAFA